MGDTEWFDIAYHVYLAAFLGGGAILVASGYVGDAPLDDADVQRVLHDAPGYLGVVVAIAIAIGLRSGADGGPLSIEAGDARHLMLAPISRRAVLRQPFLQRVRAVGGTAALLGGTAGLLAAQRMPGTAASWVISGAAFGACVGVVSIAFAVHAHAFGIAGWAATLIGGAICAVQLWVAVSGQPGPFDTLGDLALWGDRPEPVDLISVGVVVAVAIAAMLFVGRLRLEHLDRRSDLVSQLRFAVTTQDLRTVVLLRRQLRQEQPRSRPLFELPRVGTGAAAAALRRGAVSLLRSPLARFGRIVALGAAAGVAAAMTAQGTTPAVVVCGMILFVMGLDLVEPLSQEIDHPGLSESLPVESGWLHLRLLAGPAALAIVPAAAGAIACALVAPGTAVAAVAFAVPITWSGMTGSVVNVLRDDIAGSQSENVFVPPEMAGMKNVIILLVPLVVSTLGPASILVLRAVPNAVTAAQLAAGLIGYIALVGWWVRKRGDLRQNWSAMKQGAMT